MGAYENPITYVDTESAKYYAGAISQIGQVGAKLITDETQRRKKEAEENRIRNEKRQQRFKKIQLETQSNVNDALKTLDFSENESFRKGMGNIIDEYALTKSAYEFETDPAKSKELGNKIFKMDSFFKKSFGSEMDDLMADVEMYKKVQNNAGNEGGISKYMDSNYGTLLQYMANNTDPGNLEFEFDVDSGDVILVLSGKDENGEDLYTGPGVKDGVYKVSLKGNQSSELPIIPEVNLRKSNGKSKTGEKLPSTLQNIGVYNANNQVPAQYYDKKVTETKLDNGNIITQFTFNDLGKSVIRKEIEAEVIGLLTSGEGPAQGVQSANLLYQNVLTNNETLDENGSFVLNGQNIPITKESFDSMVDKLTQREVDYVQNNMPIQTTRLSTDTGLGGTKSEREEKDALDNFARTESVSIASGSGITELYDQVKSNISSYDYDPGKGFTSNVRSEKDYKEGIASLTPQQLHEQGLIATFTESERKNPYQQNSNKFKSTVQDKIDNYLAGLGDSEDKFVNFNDGSEMSEKDALVALFKSTPKYKNLKTSQIEKLVIEALEKRPKDENKKEGEKEKFDGKKFVDNTLKEINSAYKNININI